MKKQTNKIIAILCTVALLLSVVNVGFFITASSAVQNNMVLSSDANNSYSAKFGHNLLAGCTIETTAMKDGAPNNVKMAAAEVTLTDSITTYGSQIQVSGWDNGYTLSKANVNTYIQLTFTPSGTINNPAKFLIAHAPASRASESVLYANWYSIYASDSEATLYDDANLVYEYYDPNAGVEQVIDISDKNLTNVNYFGIRYYDTGQAGCIILPAEIALYAEKDNTQNNSSYSVGSDGTYDSNVKLGTNILSSATITASYTIGGQKTEGFAPADWSGKEAALVDGKVDNSAVYQCSGWDNNYNPNTDKYIDIDFELASAASNVEKFLVAHKTTEGDKATTWYAVYMATSKAELDNISPVISWKNANSTLQEQIFDLTKKNLSGVKFVRVRYYDLANGCIIKPVEVGMYSGRTVSATSSTTLTDDKNNSYNSVYGKNMLAGSTVTATAIKDGSPTTLSHNPDASILTDGTTASRNQIQASMGWDNNYSLSKANENTYIDITFATPSPLNNIETFLIAHENAGNEASLSSGSQWYSIYAASTEAELNSADPIFTYKSQSQGIEQVIDLVPANLSNVKYFRVRYYHIAQYASILVPSEIALYGMNISIITGPFSSDSNGNYSTVYGANLLANTTLVSSVVDDTHKGNTFNREDQWGKPQLSVLTDGSNSSMNMFQTKEAIGSVNDYEQTDEYVSILFNADTPLNDLNTMLIAWDTPSRVTNDNTETDATSLHYAVFMGSDMDTLYEKPLFTYQSSTRQGNEHVLDLSGAKLSNIKYIGIRFYEMAILGATCITPSEIGLYGGGISAEIRNSHKSATFADQFGENRLAESVISGFETNDNGITRQSVPGADADLIDGTLGNYANMLYYDFNNPDACLLNKGNNGIDQTDAYFQVDFAINGVVNNPEKFFFAFHEGSDTSISSQHYAFFMSSEKETLYDEANKIYEYKTTAGTGQGVEHLYDISSAGVTDVKFVGIRFYHRGYKGYTQHLIEVGMYGGEFIFDTSKVHQYKSFHEELSKYGQNYLRWHAVDSIATNGTKTVEAPISNSNLTDSTINMYMFNVDDTVLTEQNNSITQRTAYIQWTFDLCGVLDNPYKFIIDFHEGNNPERSSRHYEVFASDKVEDLYNSSNSIYEYTTESGEAEGVQHQLRLDHLNLTGLQYFGIRIYHRGYQGHYQHIADIGLYGNENTKFVADMTKLSLQVEGTHRFASWVGAYGTNYFATAEGSIIATNGSSTAEVYCPAILTEDRFTENVISEPNILTKANNWSPENPQKAAYLQITEKLAGVVDNPERVSIGWHEGTSANRASRCYEVFASKTEKDLYKPESSIYYYEGAAKGVEHHIDTSGMGLEDIRYIGIRFYHRTSVEQVDGKNVENGAGLFLSEIGFFGGEFTKDPVIDSIENSGDVSGENLAPFANIFATAYKNGEYMGDVMADFTSIIDGNDETSVIVNHEDMPQNDTTLGNGTAGKNNFYTLDFYLRYNTFIDTVCIVNADKANDRMYRYEFYLSTNIGTLYDKSNLIFQGYEGDGITNGEFINSSKDKVQIFNFKDSEAFGKYFGIKVYETGNGASKAQLDIIDIEIFGEERSYTSTSGIHFSESEYNDLGENILLGDKAFRVRNNGTVQATYIDDTKPMTDGKFGSFMAISEYKDDGAFDIMYVIDDETPYTINKFFLAGISNPKNWNEKWFTAKYEVYASIELDDIFAPESKIYDYDFERDGLSRWQIVNLDKEIHACYIAIRIIDSAAFNEDQVGVRIEEFGLYGDVADIDYQPTNLSSYLPVTAYLTDSKGATTEVDDKDFTVKENIYISDSNETTVADFTTKGQKLDLVFNLCNDVEISKIKVLAESKKLSYNVYAAFDVGQVWADEALIGTYNGSDTPFEVLKDEELLEARYIRVSFAATNGDKITVKDIQVIGLENQLLKHKALSRSLSGSNASVFARDIATNELTYDNFQQGAILFDSDYYGAAMTYIGVQGKSTANVMVNLGGLKNIDEIGIYFTRHMFRNQPLELKIYASNTYEGAMDFSAEPIATFKGLPEGGKYSISFKPMLARYVRIEVVKNNYDPATGEGDFVNKENMTLAFSEIEIFGTSVVGMQTSFDRDDIMSFTDPETQITWEIVRVDETDIITSVYSSKLVTYKASNWQKTSINKNPYFKVLNDDVYGIEFYDFFGNKVENIEGREIRVTIPVEPEMLGGGSMLGDASDPFKIEAIETNDGEDVVYTTFMYKPDSKIALLVATDSEDEYWSTIGELENFKTGDEEEDSSDDSDLDFDFDLDLEDDSDFLGDEDLNEGETTETSKTKITKKVTTTVPPLWLFIVDGALVLFLLAAITTIIVIGVKRKKANKI